MFWELKRKLNDYRFERKMSKQRYKKGYADCDCWGMYYWFANTFAKMIRNLADRKHGAPELEFEEVDNFPIDWIEKHKVIIDERAREKDYEPFDLYSIFSRWELILLRIAWCFEQSSDEITEIKNEFEEEYMRQVWGDDTDADTFDKWWSKHSVVKEYDKKGSPKLWRLVLNDADPELEEKYRNRDKEINEYRCECKDEAFDLLKKYFYHLWD